MNDQEDEKSTQGLLIPCMEILLIECLSELLDALCRVNFLLFILIEIIGYYLVMFEAKVGETVHRSVHEFNLILIYFQVI